MLDFFSNKINIDAFAEDRIKDLAFFRNTIKTLEGFSLFTGDIQSLEQEAYNLLVSHIELQKGSSRVEVGVIGGFSSGKSTFINSLFKKDVCPMAVSPSTSSITKFYYGYEEKIILNGKEIDFDAYQNLVQHLKETKETETYQIEYAYPFEKFSSIILYDTPGFSNSENENDEKVTLKTLESVDIVFFVIDISKGSLDASSLERLKTLRDKKLYCILNKSDLKSQEGIANIKKNIEDSKIFVEVIEYSAFKVLEEGKRDFFKETMEYIEKHYIYQRKAFKTALSANLEIKEGRRRTTQEYKVKIGRREFVVDAFYEKAHKQREKIEELLYLLGESKRVIIEKNFKNHFSSYKIRVKEIVSALITNVENSEDESNLLASFSEDIDLFWNTFEKFQEKHMESFYSDIIRCYERSLFIRVVSKTEKSYWNSPYSKIYCNKMSFINELSKVEFFSLMYAYIKEYHKYFEETYTFNLVVNEDGKDKIIAELSAEILNLMGKNNYFKDGHKGTLYFETEAKAKEFIARELEVKLKTVRYMEYSMFQVCEKENDKNIETFKASLMHEDAYEPQKKQQLKEDLADFIKEKDARSL